MTIADIVTAAGQLLDSADAGMLTQCARRALDEIAAEYFPLVERETLTPTEGKLPFDRFSRTPLRVYGVTRNGRAVAYGYYADGLTVEGGGACSVTYGYLPAGDDAAVHPSVPVRTAAYGAAAEYCLLNGLYDDAAMWDKRFRDSLMRLKKRGRRLPQRRWL